jgi:hypothetical protein
MPILFSERGGKASRTDVIIIIGIIIYLLKLSIAMTGAGTLEQLLRITFGSKRVDDEAVDEISDSPSSIFVDDAMICNARCPN